MSGVGEDASRSWAASDAPGAEAAASTDRPVHAQDDDALFTVGILDDGGFQFESFNETARALSGLTHEEVLGRSPEDVLPPTSAALVTARYRQCLAKGKPISYVETLDFPTGASDWRTALEPILDASGRVVRIQGSARQLGVLGPRQAVTSDEDFCKALDIFPMGIALLDEGGNILFVNTAWQRFGEHYGGAASAVGSAYVEVCGRSTAAGLPNGAEVAPELGRLLAGELQNFGLRYTWEDRYFVLRATRFVLGGRVRLALAHQDVTDLTSAQVAAARSAEQLLRAQDEERARIAMELHDSTSQHLAAIGLGLARLRQGQDASRVIDDMRRALAEAQREIRTLTYLLYPPKLAKNGLVATLHAFVDGFRRRTDLRVDVSTTGKLDALPETVRQAVFRVVQEALANVHRHAGASVVSVEVALRQDGLHLAISDDGDNLRRRTTGAPAGVGIRGMQERFARLGGELTVCHRATGTIVEGTLPPSQLHDGTGPFPLDAPGRD